MSIIRVAKGTFKTTLQRGKAVYRSHQELGMAKKFGIPIDGSWGIQPTVFRKCALGLAFVGDLLKTGNYSRVFTEVIGVTAEVDGKKYVTFSTCDYLGLSTHPRIIEAAKEALSTFGTTNSSSRLTTGTMEQHLLLEQRMAEFIGGEACLIYITGYLANLGSIPALVNEGEFIVVDQKSHNSIVNACALAKQKGARVLIYQHNDMAALAKRLKQCGLGSNKLIITDGVFSMDGDMCRLDDILVLAQKHRAGVFVDDAHGTGVMGKNGTGTAEMFGLQGKPDLTMVTLSKVFPGLGGCLIGKKEIIDFLRVASDPFIFSLALPPVYVATTMTALDIIEEHPELREKLWTNIDYIKGELLRLGYNIGGSETAILPIFIGDDEKTNQLTAKLKEAGFIVDPMVYPAVGKGEALVRLVITAAHSLDHLAGVVGVFDYAGKQLGIIN